jgi:hypothetical protein
MDLEEKKKRKKKSKVKVKRDACYRKVKRRYKVWPSAYASGALVQCRKVGAKNWGNKSKKKKKNEAIEINEKIEKVDGKWVVYPSKGGKRLGTHDTEKEALAQLRAIEASKARAAMNEQSEEVTPEELEQILIDKGGAADIDAFEEELPNVPEDLIAAVLGAMEYVGRHEEGDYVLDDDGEIEITKEVIRRMIEEEIDSVLEAKSFHWDEPDWFYGGGYGDGTLEEKKKKRKKRKKAGTESSKETSLRDWFGRKGAKGKKKGWVDCNAPDGKGGYKSCGRGKGEKRKKYPACRPTPAACKERGKGKTWGKKAKRGKKK